MRLNKLAPSQRIQGRWLLYLEDGSILRVGENEIVAFGLYAGMELSAEKQEELGRAAAVAGLKERALKALAVRPHSRRELVQKLSSRPRKPKEGGGEETPDPATIEAVADRLEELGYLNDREYAKTVVRHYCAKGYGPRKLQDELYRRGVPRDYWEEALDEAPETNDKIDLLIVKKMRGMDPKDPKALKRASDTLARRGYHWNEIKEALQRYGAECYDD